MTIDPEVAAVVGALLFGVAVGLPGLHKAALRRRRAVSECLSCGRTLVLGHRTCDCSDQ
jgi:hypothetical protein